MSSPSGHQFLTAEHLNMLQRVLKKAGMQGASSMSDPAAYTEAVRFLIGLFQSGNNDEERLYLALAEHYVPPSKLNEGGGLPGAAVRTGR